MRARLGHRDDWHVVSYHAGQAQFFSDPRRPRPVALGDGNERTAAGPHLEGPQWRRDHLTPDPAARIGLRPDRPCIPERRLPGRPPGARHEDRETPGSHRTRDRMHVPAGPRLAWVSATLPITAAGPDRNYSGRSGSPRSVRRTPAAGTAPLRPKQPGLAGLLRAGRSSLTENAARATQGHCRWPGGAGLRP
jgi:hypothetical protein